MWHDSFVCVPWLIRMCDVTHSYVWHDSFVCVTWLIRICAMTHSHVWHDSFVCVPWLIRTCAMTHSYVCHDSFVCVLERRSLLLIVPRLIFKWHESCMWDMTHQQHTIPSICWWPDSFICGTTNSSFSCRNIQGFLVIFLKYKALLQKYRAFLQRCSALLQKYTAFCSIYLWDSRVTRTCSLFCG
jgi:hypothetical protein